jgi:hypothetical protein
MQSNLLHIENFVDGYSGNSGNNCYFKPNDFQKQKFSTAAAVPLTSNNPDCDSNLGHLRQFLTCGSNSTSKVIKDLPNFPSTNLDGQTVLWLRNDDCTMALARACRHWSVSGKELFWYLILKE